MGALEKIFRIDARAFNKIKKIADKAIAYADEMAKLSDEELQAKTPYFKQLLASGKTLDEIQPEAFAVCREAAKRVIGQYPYNEQVFGAQVLHEGDVAEMKTGEGKTLTATMAVYTNALSGKGVHVVTVNEYLASRDADWMGRIYRFLGLTVGVNLREKSTQEKQEAYKCDVTYTTNSEVGFDYLRDNMATDPKQRVLRELNFAVIDEADSILIDESRTPLIISGGSGVTASSYEIADRVVKSLKKNTDFEIDIKKKSCSLTDSGVDKVQKAFGVTNLYEPQHSDMVHRIHQALKANFTMSRNVEYMVKNDEIVLIDTNTGRTMEGREYSDGLQQAIQAKEHVKIKPETITLATITYQNFFRLYNKLSGMTGTAKTEEEEFRKIYNMRVICIPTHRPVQRIDDVDAIFATAQDKYQALLKEIEMRHAKGQPILVGTASVEKSEIIHELLEKAGLKHEVLNAKNHEREAHIIENAGKKGAVTIATNMAGRGTDIKLGEGVRELGGLYVIGTERHDSRRIDNQLRGRSGRQGDPGTTRFFVSMEDDLMVKFGSEKMKTIMESLGISGDQAISNKMISKNIESAQKKVEGFNFDRRKGLLDFDNVISKQREIIYERRNEILDKDSIRDRVLDTFKEFVTGQINSHLNENNTLSDNDIDNIMEQFNAHLLKRTKLKKEDFEGKKPDEVIDFIYKIVVEDYNKKLEDIPEEIQNDFEKTISLRIIDKYWMDQLDAMENLKEGVGLRGYAQSNPLQVYALEGFQLFDNMMASINAEISNYLLNAEVRQNIEREEVKNIKTNDGKEGVKNTPKKAKEKIGRNDPCPCGSGKKYKNCCGK